MQASKRSAYLFDAEVAAALDVKRARALVSLLAQLCHPLLYATSAVLVNLSLRLSDRLLSDSDLGEGKGKGKEGKGRERKGRAEKERRSIVTRPGKEGEGRRRKGGEGR